MKTREMWRYVFGGIAILLLGSRPIQAPAQTHPPVIQGSTVRDVIAPAVQVLRPDGKPHDLVLDRGVKSGKGIAYPPWKTTQHAATAPYAKISETSVIVYAAVRFLKKPHGDYPGGVDRTMDLIFRKDAANGEEEDRSQAEMTESDAVKVNAAFQELLRTGRKWKRESTAAKPDTISATPYEGLAIKLEKIPNTTEIGVHLSYEDIEVTFASLGDFAKFADQFSHALHWAKTLKP